MFFSCELNVSQKKILCVASWEALLWLWSKILVDYRFYIYDKNRLHWILFPNRMFFPFVCGTQLIKKHYTHQNTEGYNTVPEYVKMLASEWDHLPYCDIISIGELVINLNPLWYYPYPWIQNKFPSYCKAVILVPFLVYFHVSIYLLLNATLKELQVTWLD